MQAAWLCFQALNFFQAPGNKATCCYGYNSLVYILIKICPWAMNLSVSSKGQVDLFSRIFKRLQYVTKASRHTVPFMFRLLTFVHSDQIWMRWANMLTTQDVCMLVQFLDALSLNSVPDCSYSGPIFQMAQHIQWDWCSPKKCILLIRCLRFGSLKISMNTLYEYTYIIRSM